MRTGGVRFPPRGCLVNREIQVGQTNAKLTCSNDAVAAVIKSSEKIAGSPCVHSVSPAELTNIRKSKQYKRRSASRNSVKKQSPTKRRKEHIYELF